MTNTPTKTTPGTALALPPNTVPGMDVDFVLLDGSSSMLTKWHDMLKAIDAYMADCANQAVNSRAMVTIFTDEALDTLWRDQAMRDWTPFSQVPPDAPYGGTPLYDGINIMGRTLRDLDPGKCSILIVTDGEENGSKFTNSTQARAILDWCRAKGWQVTFLGCDFNNSEEAKLLGADENTTIGVAKARLTDATKAMAKKRKHYQTTGEDITWSGDEKQQFGGYLAAPTTK